MLFVLLFLTILTGTVLTFVFDDDSPFWARICAGIAISQVFLGTFGFFTAMALGMTQASVWLAALLVCLPLLLLIQTGIRAKFLQNFTENRARIFDVLQKPTVPAFLTAISFSFFLFLLWFFFSRAMFYKNGGIWSGASQNFGDLPYHLGAINSFFYGQNFLPENPSFAGAKFTYPFIADFVATQFMTFGIDIKDAFQVQNFLLIVSLVGLLYWFGWRLFENKAVARLVPFLFLLCGGLGFVMFFKEAATGGKGIFELLQNLPADYTIRGEGGWRWGNVLVVLFVTQRSLLLGLPIALIVLTKFWDFFNREPENINQENPEVPRVTAAARHQIIEGAIIGILAGSLILVHAHSFAVLMFAAVCLAVMRLKNWKIWAAVFIGAGIISLPELLFLTTGSATSANSFFGFHLGWDHGEENIIWFWLKNTGFFIPLLLISLYWLNRGEKPDETSPEISALARRRVSLLLFYIPFALCFVISNLFKLAPWEWDNIKVLVYWHVVSVPFVAWFLVQLWERGDNVLKPIVGGLCIGLTLAGGLDVWRQATGAIGFEVFSADSVKIAEQIRQKTAPKSLFLNAPTFNTAIVLSGRRSLMRYNGHLQSHGIDFEEREKDVKEIYEGSPMAEYLLNKYEIEYVLISPEEFSTLEGKINEAFFEKFPVVALAGGYRVHKIR